MCELCVISAGKVKSRVIGGGGGGGKEDANNSNYNWPGFFCNGLVKPFIRGCCFQDAYKGILYQAPGRSLHDGSQEGKHSLHICRFIIALFVTRPFTGMRI